MPFPKLSMIQIADKQVAIAVAEDPKLEHFKQHLDAAGYQSEIQTGTFQIVFRTDSYKASRVLMVHGDIHEVSEVIRECWP